VSLLVTLTHARLRAAQGDLAGAREILREILRRKPDHAAARELLDELAGRVSRAADEPAEAVLPAPRAADPGELAARFRTTLTGRHQRARVDPRIARLEAWLTRIRRDHPGV